MRQRGARGPFQGLGNEKKITSPFLIDLNEELREPIPGRERGETSREEVCQAVRRISKD